MKMTACSSRVRHCSMNREKPLLKISKGIKSFEKRNNVLSDINLELNYGESKALIGRSGSGKSTLLSIIGLLDTFDSGSMELDSMDISKIGPSKRDRLRGTDIGFVFQRFSLIPHLSVQENVMTPLRHSSSLGLKQMRLKASMALEQVKLDGLERRSPRKLSGGEQQRVAIARALVHGPKLILADEPTGSLDPETGNSILDTLLEMVHDLECGLIVVTHDRRIAASMGSTLELDARTLKEMEPQAVVGKHRRTEKE